MSGMPLTTPSAPDSSLFFVLDYLAKHPIESKHVWAVLDRTDRDKLKSLLSQVDIVESSKFDKAAIPKKTAKSFEAEKSAAKGKLFEQIASVLLAGVSCFNVHADVTTSTNQLDVLVTLGPMASIVPAFREWGTHFICECKFHDKGVSISWIQKLESLMGTHGSTVGVLISRKPISKGSRGNIPHALQLYSMNGVYILCLSREDLDKCAAGGSLIDMLVERYVSVQIGISNFFKAGI